MEEREFDVVVLGATGFTGRLVAEHVVGRAGGLRIAVAGRDRARVDRVADELGRAGRRPATAVADTADLVSLLDLAARTRVLATTVGPYARHGELVVQACVRSGTSYADITGEPAFVDRVRARHDRDAARAGVRVVTCCGFDSVPHDLGARETVRALPRGAPITVRAYVSGSGRLSGGTWQSALEAIATADLGAVAAGKRGPAPDGRRVGLLPARVARVPEIDGWAVPLPTIDPQIVLRSARALPEYGPDFRYGHHARVGSLPVLAGGVAALGVVAGLARVGPTRRLLSRLRPAGSGPTEEQRAGGRFRVTLLGEGGGRRVRTEVRGDDPGYTETAVMLGEAALALAADDLPPAAGVLTPAVGLGDPYLARLRSQDLTFTTREGWA